MIKGIQAAGAALKPMMSRLEVIANNLANIDTTGFKKDNIFVQMMKDTEIAQAQGKGDLAGYDVKRYSDFAEGSLKETHNPLDFAIQGRGFFVVDTPLGKRYTRNGNFTLSVDGTLQTSQGHPVMGSAGAIRFPDMQKLAHGEVAVSEEGEIMVDKTMLAQLQIADFDDVMKLKKDGDSFIIEDAQQKPVQADRQFTRVKQGYLEESNVEGIEEMIALVELTRNFESSQRIIQYQDSTLDKIMDVGRV
jgi:flagellar basal-body rod protein FlgG